MGRQESLFVQALSSNVDPSSTLQNLLVALSSSTSVPRSHPSFLNFLPCPQTCFLLNSFAVPNTPTPPSLPGASSVYHHKSSLEISHILGSPSALVVSLPTGAHRSSTTHIVHSGHLTKKNKLNKVISTRAHRNLPYSLHLSVAPGRNKRAAREQGKLWTISSPRSPSHRDISKTSGIPLLRSKSPKIDRDRPPKEHTSLPGSPSFPPGSGGAHRTSIPFRTNGIWH